MGEWMDGWMDACMHTSKQGEVDALYEGRGVVGRYARQKGRSVEGMMDGWLDGWFDVLIDWNERKTVT